MPNMAEKPAFLKLPTELRLKIYDYVVHTDIKSIVIKDIQHTSDSNGTQAVLIPLKKPNLRGHIPWLNMQLTSKYVAWELKSYMADPSFLNNENNRTYSLNLDVFHNYGSPSSKPNRMVTWHSLPCPPADARVLVMNVAAKSGSGPWTEGGSASLARALYQLLNHLVHKGPQIVTTKLLADHMVLRELVINVKIGTNTTSPVLGCNTLADHNWRLFVQGWEQVSKTGFLSGYVEKTRLRSVGDSASETEIGIEWQKVPLIPGFWRGYGFQWGV